MRRLFEDPEQPATLREDLLRSRAAGQDYPSADKLAQLRAALSDPARQPLEQGSRLGEAWRTLHPGWKLAALVTLAGAGALLTQPTTREPAPSAVREPQPQPRAAETDAPSEPVVVPEAPRPAPKLAAASEPVVSPAPVEAPLPAAGAEPTHAVSNVSEPSAAAPTKSSRREIAQLVRIRSLLQQDPAAAYHLAQRSEREFPGGLLSEERQALAIVALRKTGSRELAAAKAREFFARFPHSPMRGLIEAELRGERR